MSGDRRARFYVWPDGLILAIIQGGGPATFAQAAFRGRDDDGSQTAATWKDVANANWSQNVDENFRVRFAVTNGGMTGTLIPQLQYNLGGAGWNNVTTTSDVVRAVTSTHFTHDDTTTQQISAGTFTAGRMSATGTATGIAYGALGDTEAEYNLQIRSADVADGNTIQLRVINDATALDTYTNTPTVTVVAGAPTTDADAGNAPATGTANDAVATVSTGAEAPAATATANDATVTTSGAAGITVAATDGAANSGSSAALDLTLDSTEGNFQVVYLGGRNLSMTPSITGDGWSTPVLVEVEISNTSARRQLAMWWRVVPSGQSTTVSVNWNVTATKAAFGIEFNSDTPGGAWSKDNHDPTDSGTTTVTELASGSAAPANAEAVTVYGVMGRTVDFDLHASASYTNSFTKGPGAFNTGSNGIGITSGYRIDSGTNTTTASWATATLVNGIITAFSVSSGAATDADAGNAPATGTSNNATTTIDTTSEHAVATATANDATVSTASATNAQAENAPATGIANNPAAAIDTAAEHAAATGTANDATVNTTAGTDADAGVAPATATANDATVTTAAFHDADAESAAATGVASDPVPAVDTGAQVAAATGTANDAVVQTGAFTNAPAGNAAATGAANDATVTVDTSAEAATATGAALDATVTIGINVAAEVAAATATANDATVRLGQNAHAEPALATGTANDATLQIIATAEAATALAAALDANVSGGDVPAKSAATVTASVQSTATVGAAVGSAATVTASVQSASTVSEG
jgi:trimeric autotransporter adhesin